MKKCRWTLAADQPGDLNLAAGRIEQILSSNDEVHVLQPVIDDDRELIGPVAVSIADEQIAALFGGLLLLPPKPEIVEQFERRLKSQTDTKVRRLPQPFVAAGSWIAARPDLRARALASVRQSACAQLVERALVHRTALALPGQLSIGCETEPRQIFEQRRLELWSASGAIVIFNA